MSTHYETTTYIVTADISLPDGRRVDHILHYSGTNHAEAVAAMAVAATSYGGDRLLHMVRMEVEHSLAEDDIGTVTG